MTKIFVTQSLIYGIILLSVGQAKAQFTEVTWKDLSQVNFKEEYNAEYDFKVMIPEFSENIKKLHGRKIEIEGYYIPIDEVGYEKSIILSAFPNSQCFFCGLSGPESVMEVKVKQIPKNLKLDSKLRFRGTLELNEKDLSRLNYILNQAEMVP